MLSCYRSHPTLFTLDAHNKPLCGWGVAPAKQEGKSEINCTLLFRIGFPLELYRMLVPIVRKYQANLDRSLRRNPSKPQRSGPKAKSGEKFQLVIISFPIGIVRSSVPFHHRTRSEQNQRTIEQLQAKMKSLSDEPMSLPPVRPRRSPTTPHNTTKSLPPQRKKVANPPLHDPRESLTA